MVSPVTVYQFALVGAIVTSMLVAGLAWSRRPKAGTRPLAGTMTATLFWLVTTLLSWLSADPGASMFWRRLTYVGITLVIVFLALFTFEYVGRNNLVRPSIVGLLLVEPVVVNALVWTNEAHGLVWDPATTPGTPATFTYGPAFWGVAAYSYLVVLVSAALLLRTVYRSREFYRGQAIPIVVGMCAPVVGHVAFVLTGSRFDLAPLAFTVTGVAFTFAVYRRDLLSIAPVARDRLIAEMTDPVVVIDTDGTITDYNPAAVEIAAVDDPLGKAPADAFGVDLLKEADSEDGVISLDVAGQSVHFDLRVTPFGDGAGHLVVLRDITAQRNREQELELLKQVMSRFLRHNLRNDLNVVIGHAETIEHQTEGTISEQARTIDDICRQIIDKSDKTRVVESIVDAGGERTRLEVVALVRRVIDDYDGRTDATFETRLPDEQWVLANPKLDVAVKNLVENAIVHNDAERPTVRVEVRTDDGVRLTVTDNGPGIPDSEIEPIRKREETELAHGSGIGLYLVHWIVRKSGGSLSFDPGESRVTVTLQPAQSPSAADETSMVTSD